MQSMVAELVNMVTGSQNGISEFEQTRFNAQHSDDDSTGINSPRIIVIDDDDPFVKCCSK